MTTITADAEPISKALAIVQKGGDLESVLTTLVRVPVAEVPAISQEMPKVTKVTNKITQAVTTLGLQTEGHVHLTVTERRPLTETELDTLSSERDALDALDKYIKARIASHKVMLYNHWDAEIDDREVKPKLDDKGRYLTKESTYAQGGARHFDRQLAEGGPSVTAHALEEIADTGKVEGFGHEEYLKCTSPVRVLDEAKVMLLMRTSQPVIAALREAVKPGGVSSSFYHRPS